MNKLLMVVVISPNNSNLFIIVCMPQPSSECLALHRTYTINYEFYFFIFFILQVCHCNRSIKSTMVTNDWNFHTEIVLQ